MAEPACNFDVLDEMIDGVIIAMSPSPSFNHDVVVVNITRIFKGFLKGKTCSVHNNLDVHLTNKDRLLPDVSVVCNKNLIKHNGIYGPPDLVVKVLSPNTTKRDKGYKMKLYEQSGVKEYWLVNTAFESRSIDVYLLVDGKFELDNVYSIYPEYVLEQMSEKEKAAIPTEFKTSLFDDLVITLDEVFEGL